MPPAVVMIAASLRGDDAIERAALMAAEGRRAGHLDEIGNAGAVILLDQPVELDERPAQMLRQHAAERRLAGAAQADQRDAPRAVGAARPRQAGLDIFGKRRQFTLRHLRQQIEDGAERRGARAGFRQQRGTGQVERLRDGAQHADGRIADAAFDLRQVALGSLRGLRQLPPRHAALGAVAPDLAPDRGEECGCGGGKGW